MTRPAFSRTLKSSAQNKKVAFFNSKKSPFCVFCVLENCERCLRLLLRVKKISVTEQKVREGRFFRARECVHACSSKCLDVRACVCGSESSRFLSLGLSRRLVIFSRKVTVNKSAKTQFEFLLQVKKISSLYRKPNLPPLSLSLFPSHTGTHTRSHTCIFTTLCLLKCPCVGACEREREKERMHASVF